MTELGRVHTGRTLGRAHRAGYCQGCEQRIMLGDPRLSSSWPARLTLEREQWELLLLAAAEYAALSDEAGEYESAVAFVDWMGVDALRGRDSLLVEADGAPPRFDGGAVAQSNARNAHRHPWPLPVVEWRPSRREG